MCKVYHAARRPRRFGQPDFRRDMFNNPREIAFVGALLMAENHSRQDHNDVVDALRTAQVVQRSHLAASPTRVWERISTREGINAELMPIVAMTFPTKWISLDPKDVAVGPPLFRSVLLLFGVVPVD